MPGRGDRIFFRNPPTQPNLFSIADIEKNMVSVIGDIRDRDHLMECFEKAQPEIVLHLAAQPIVRGIV